jgi:hypothetical protein
MATAPGRLLGTAVAIMAVAAATNGRPVTGQRVA